MKLYHVEYCNGAEYDTWLNCFVGVYTTQKLAEEAVEMALDKHGRSCGRAYCNVDEIIVDEMP